MTFTAYDASAYAFKGVYAYVDASYAVHPDMKSHTGCVISLVMGHIYAKSSTQKLNTKSSTEAELVGRSDCSNQLIWMDKKLLANTTK